MESYLINPFGAGDSERRQIWEMLVARDSDAFAAQNWKMVENDFIPERFDGISGNGSDNPDAWTLKYPTLVSYRDDWLAQGAEYAKVPLTAISHRDLVYKLTTMNEIEIKGDRAICHKKFHADEPLKNGERFRLAAQTIYRLHRIGSIWKIVGFVGYLPYPMGS